MTAGFPSHVFLVDLTDTPSFFGLFHFKLAVLLDVFSRFPVAARVFSKEPTGEDLAQVLVDAMRRHGAPRHLVSDRGSQLTLDWFRGIVRRLGIPHRFGALGTSGSIAGIERL